MNSHHTNPNYQCSVVEWNDDASFRCRRNGCHGMLPADQELVELVETNIQISPTLWVKILAQINPASRLHEIL